MGQTRHDREVKKIADELSKKGWKVKADHTSKYETPDGIGKNNRIPDIVAEKKGNTRLIEIDSGPKEDPNQISTFRRSAGQKERTTFRKIVLNS